MKKTTLFITILLLSFSFSFAQFEGKVTMTNSDGPGKMVFSVKGDQVKMVPELDNKTATMFMNGKSGDMIMIMEEKGEKFGIKLNLNGNSMIATQMRMAMEQGGEKESKAATMTWTGEKQTINGQSCEKVTGTNSEGSYTAWVAKDIKLSIADLFPINSPMTNEIKEKMFSMGMEGFPMRVSSTDKNGKKLVMNTMVEETSVSEKDVTPDPGIEILDMDNFMQEIMAAQNDPAKMKSLEKKMERLQHLMGN